MKRLLTGRGQGKFLFSLLCMFLTFVYTLYILLFGGSCMLQYNVGQQPSPRRCWTRLDCGRMTGSNGYSPMMASTSRRPRLVAFYGKPVDEIPRLDTQKIDRGKRTGDEVWWWFLSRGTLSIWPPRPVMSRGNAVRRLWSAAICSTRSAVSPWFVPSPTQTKVIPSTSGWMTQRRLTGWYL